MTSSTKFIFDITFVESGFRIRYPAERPLLERFCSPKKGGHGFIVLHDGEQTRSLAQNAFFHGPLIDAFVDLTGEPDRRYWKNHLKDIFRDKYFVVRTESGKPYLRGTADLSVREMRDFIEDCLNYLFSQGGHLSEWQGEEWKRVREIGKRAEPETAGVGG